MAKGEVSWKRDDAEGERVQVYAHRSGKEWQFFIRSRRYDNWQPLDKPPLEDWLELLDGLRRRAGRRLVRPEEVLRVENRIRELFPGTELA